MRHDEFEVGFRLVQSRASKRTREKVVVQLVDSFASGSK
jgi:hypothetical protein